MGLSSNCQHPQRTTQGPIPIKLASTTTSTVNHGAVVFANSNSIQQFYMWSTTNPSTSLSPFTNQPPPTPVTDDRDQPFGSPPQTASPLSPFVETPVRSPTPQPLPLETAPKYVMELRIVTKTKGKRGKAGEDFKITKSPIRLSLDLTYLEFLKEVAKVAEVKVSQLDCEPSVNVAAAIFLAYFAFMSIIRRLFVII